MRCATDCSQSKDLVSTFVRASLADSTRRAYAADLSHFFDWGGRLPAKPASIAAYLAAHAGTLSIATLDRRRAALAKAHAFASGENPARSALVNATMRGMKRMKGRPQRQAMPLLPEDLAKVVRSTGRDLTGQRDRALLLIGFWGALRRSELVGLDVTDLVPDKDGLSLMVRRSKTDPHGRGHRIKVALNRSSRLCAVRAVAVWMKASGHSSGPLFRAIDRHGNVGPRRLSGEAVSVIVKQRTEAAGFDPRLYSGHSLRAGYVTAHALAGVAEWRIRRQTGHTSNVMLARYIRDNPELVAIGQR
jgi:integrase